MPFCLSRPDFKCFNALKRQFRYQFRQIVSRLPPMHRAELILAKIVVPQAPAGHRRTRIKSGHNGRTLSAVKRFSLRVTTSNRKP